MDRKTKRQNRKKWKCTRSTYRLRNTLANIKSPKNTRSETMIHLQNNCEVKGKTLRQSIMGQERKRNLSKMPFNSFSFGHLLLGMEFVCQWNSVGKKKLGSFLPDVPYGLGMWTYLYFHSQHWGRTRSRPVHALWMPTPSNNPDYWFSFNLSKPYCCKQHLHNSLNTGKLNWCLPT